MSLTKSGAKDLVATLPTMSLTELRAEWRRHYDEPHDEPPRIRAADMIRRVLAWRIQADAYGDFDAVTRKLIARAADPARLPARTGMRLAREWGGHRHEVMVLEDGVAYQGKVYHSLSEVARLITGKQWNGPRFFGLRQANVR